MSKARIEFEFDMYEEREELQVYARASEWYMLLHNLDEEMRAAWKYDENIGEHEMDLIERWRGMINESGVMGL